MATDRLGLTTLTTGQEGAETDHNEALQQLDSLVHLAIEDRDLSTPPGSPTNGQSWLVKATGTGAWTGKDGDLALYYDGWLFVSPVEGMTLWVKDENLELLYDGSSWQTLATRLGSGGTDEISVAGLPGLYWSVPLEIIDGGSSLTSVAVQFQDDATATYEIVAPIACQVVGASFAAYHSNGSDPGDWTLNIYKNGAGSPSATMNWAWNAASSTIEATAATLGTPLALAAGDRIKLDGTGPSISVVVVKILLTLETT